MPVPEPRTPQRRALAGVAIGALGALGAVAVLGLCAEAIRVPDQP